jgi:hypothetical protein
LSQQKANRLKFLILLLLLISIVSKVQEKTIFSLSFFKERKKKMFLIQLFFIFQLLCSCFCLLPSNKPTTPAIDSSLNVVNVNTAKQLADALWNVKSNTAIVIAKGTYRLDSVSPFPNGVDGRLTVGRYGAKPGPTNIQIRGATGNPDDVVLKGAGMVLNFPTQNINFIIFIYNL